MRLTLYTDYCLRVLLYLGVKDDGFATIKEIAERYDISRNHLMKVVYGLNQSGYIHTLRGKHGGMRLAHEPESINLGALVQEMEQDTTLVECLAEDSKCRIAPACRLRGVFSGALEAFFEELRRFTLADILSGCEQDLRHELGITIPIREVPSRA